MTTTSYTLTVAAGSTTQALDSSLVQGVTAALAKANAANGGTHFANEAAFLSDALYNTAITDIPNLLAHAAHDWTVKLCGVDPATLPADPLAPVAVSAPDSAPAVTPLTPQGLMAYASAKQMAVLGGGLTVNGVPVETDTTGQVLLSGAVQLAQINPSQTFAWATNAGPVSLTSSQVIAVGVAVGNWVQSTFTVYGTLIAEINAGTITTTAQIDGAAWPANS